MDLCNFLTRIGIHLWRISGHKCANYDVLGLNNIHGLLFYNLREINLTTFEELNRAIIC